MEKQFSAVSRGSWRAEFEIGSDLFGD